MQTAAGTQVFKQASDAFYKAGMNWRSIPASVAGQLTPEQLQHFKDEQTDHVLRQYSQGQTFKTMGETDILQGFYAHPETLTQDAVDAAAPNLSRSSYLSLTERATALAASPKNVVEATGISDRVKFFANQAGIKDSDDKGQTAADKQNYTALIYKINNDIDQVKAQNHGKATSDQVDKVIQQELIQRTINLPRSPYSPLRVLGISDTYANPKFNFQMPPGATSIVPGSDGQLHYTDGKKDLGVAK
jgi:hypothetical protein